jgi:hypothetical protein
MQFDFTRWKHFTAMAIIGDGIMGMVHPRRDSRAWQYGPKPWQNLMQSLEEHPNLTRVIGAAQVIGGVLWVLHSEEKPATLDATAQKESSRRIA